MLAKANEALIRPKVSFENSRAIKRKMRKKAAFSRTLERSIYIPLLRLEIKWRNC